ncbi:hypothetical protein ACFQ38_16105 [Sporosarcina contaminans]|uniref:Uncharacterized protein n=1 Tax=Sporosarcina contaminans TaxID=633403 RepID=A0ABW3U1Q6_9BACL
MKKYNVKYHLTDSIFAEKIVEGGEPEDHAIINRGANYRFEGSNGIYYSFQGNDVKMVSVKEVIKSPIQNKPAGM